MTLRARLLLKRDIRQATTAHLEQRLARLTVALAHDSDYTQAPARRALVAERTDIKRELLDRGMAGTQASA